MTIKVSGKLISGTGEVLSGSTIILESISNSSQEIKGVIGSHDTNDIGEYSFNCPSGKYVVMIRQPGRQVSVAGCISVYLDSSDSSLNELLEYINPEDLTPEIVLMVKAYRDESKGYSEDAKNISDNLVIRIDERLDENDVKFNQQMANHELSFSESQLDKESRFKDMLDLMGYSFAGDYESAIITFKYRAEYIRYDNQYYRLNASTSVGFTTTGTGASSFAADVTHFVLMDGDTLRQNLVSSEGLSLLGSVSPRSGLRNVKTSYNGQSVLMKQAVIGGPVLNAIATHKPGMTAADDDYSTFITADGQVYQFDISAGIDFRLAGALLDGSNAGVSIKKIVDTEVVKAIAAGSIDACKKMVLISPLGNNDLTQLILDTNETFVIPSFMSLWHVGQVRYKFNGLTKPAFRICNEIGGLTSSMSDFVDTQGADVIKGNGYVVDIYGPNKLTYDEWSDTSTQLRSASAGIEFGNSYSSGSLLDCRDVNIENVLIRGFKAGIQWHGFDTYINSFRNINLVSNEYSFYAPTPDYSNGGERLVFDGGVAGNCFRSHFYWNQVGMSMTFKSWSFDYARENFMELRSAARGNDFIYENCWIEGFGDFLIRQYPITDTWNFRKNKITFMGGKIVGAKKSQSEWASRRKIIFAPTDNNKIEFIGTQIQWPNPPSEPYIALMGYTDDTIKYNKSRYICPGTAYEDELLNYAYGLKGDSYKFAGTEGASIKNSKDTATNISFDTNNNATGFTVEYGPLDSDGLRCVKITTTATTDLVELSDRRLMVKAPKHTVVNAGISIRMAEITAGAVTFGMRLRAYNNPVSKADPTTLVVTKTYTLNGSLASDPYNVSSLLSAAGTPLTADKYVGVQTSREMSFDSAVATHFVPTMTVSGYVGTIYLKLPVWWISNGSAPAAFSIEES